MDRLMEYEERLKKSGLKNTKSRKAILDILTESTQPLTAEDLFLNLKKSNIEINLSTVYRTLESLEKKDIVTKMNIFEDEKMMYEYNFMFHRHYLICMDCKKIITVKNCPLGEYEKRLEKETNFSIKGHRLYLYGYCEECKKNHNEIN